MNQSTEPIQTIVKIYPDLKKLTILKYKKNRDLTTKTTKKGESIFQASNLERSIRKTKTTITDYVLANNFQIFATFTFSPKKVDRFDIDACKSKLKRWLDRQREKDSNLKYVVVPERHKNGAIHFHALFENIDSFTLHKTKIRQENRDVFTMRDWRFGYSNVKFIDSNRLKVAAYITKYITKDMITIENKRRYWSSHNLALPEKFYNDVDRFEIYPDLQSLVYENAYLQMHEFAKND